MQITRRRFLQQATLSTTALVASQFAHAKGLQEISTSEPKDDSRSGMKLVLLGTAGGPTPKKNRAAPAQMIMIENDAYVVDCGNGIAQQIAKAGIKLSTLRHIFITHHHSDHNADYGNLMLLAWTADLDHPVHTYGAAPLTRMTKKFLELNEFDIQTRIKDEGRKPLSQLIKPHEIKHGGVILQTDKLKVTAAEVVHPPINPSFAYRFDHAGKSIVISGDTSYSENLVKLAYEADVLVHEIMHTPSLEKLLATEPNAKRLKQHLLDSHSTGEQVGRVATQAKVKKLVLSHFVPGGYPFLEDSVWIDAVRPYFDGEIVVASDLMEITV